MRLWAEQVQQLHGVNLGTSPCTNNDDYLIRLLSSDSMSALPTMAYVGEPAGIAVLS